MKRYYDFFTTMDNGEKEYFIIDVTKISFLRHNESKGVHGETSIYFDASQYNFSGGNNKTLYNEIRKIMSELETTN